MKRAFLIIVLAVGGALFLAGQVMAKGGGGGGMSGNAGGKSGSHFSDKGAANTNAQHLPDSTRGLDRARQRMSDEGAAHRQANNKNKKASAKLPLPPTPPGAPKLPDAPKPPRP